MMRSWSPFLVLPFILLLSSALQADIRKCKDPVSGRMTYTDKICPRKADQQHLEIHDNRVGSLSSRLIQPLSSHGESRQKPVAVAPRPKSSSGGTDYNIRYSEGHHP